MDSENVQAKAGVTGRIVAKLVDILVAWALALIQQPAGIIMGVLYLAAADGFQRGQSPGKMLVGLVVNKSDGAPCDLPSSIYRNLPFAMSFLFYAIPVMGWILLAIVGLPLLLIEMWLVMVDDRGVRLGDRIAGTEVAEMIH